MCRHDPYAGWDPATGREVIVDCVQCGREEEWAREDEIDQQLENESLREDLWP